MTSELPAPAPADITPETAPFWEATAEHRLILRKCNDCESVNWYPRVICPECGNMNTDWIEASGNGVVYSFTNNHRGQGPYRDADYVLAYVQLDEGPRIMTNIVDCEPAAITIGARVAVVFHDTGEGPSLYRFRLA